MMDPIMIIDHIDNLQLSEEEAKQYFNELRSLSYLAKGLKFLYDQVVGLEATVLAKLPKEHQVVVYGNAPQLQGVPQDLIACAFHWYAVTVCNYVRLVGWLANGNDSTKATEYLHRVLPEVYV